MPECVLRLRGITKRFGPLLANDSISLDLARGEVLALLGENGAGKSTLVAILFGHYLADAGTIEAFGQALPPGQPRAALDAGIGMVHQHSTLADNLSVLDNVMVGGEPMWRPFSRRAAARERLLASARRFGLSVQPDARVGDLSVGERQRVEILKALVGSETHPGARILILDEPTAVLTPAEAEALFDTLGQMVAQGLAIIFISHKLDEVRRVSHRIAVLRAGKLVAQAAAADVSASQLALWMVGHELAAPRRHAAQPQALPVCVLEQVRTAGPGRDRLVGVSLALCGGEIVAIAGVSGNGQMALAELLCGTRRASAPGQPARGGPAGRPLRAGGTGRGAHSGRSAGGRCRRRPAGVGERGSGTLAGSILQPHRGRFALGPARRGARPRPAHHRHLRCARCRSGRAGSCAVGRKSAKTHPRSRAAGAGRQLAAADRRASALLGAGRRRGRVRAAATARGTRRRRGGAVDF